MTVHDEVYLDKLQRVLDNGVIRSDRTGTGTISVFGTQTRYDIQHSFPLLTTKRVFTKGVFGELVFFLNGFTNNNWLNERGVTIWDEWAAEDGDLGPVYGYQWRNFGAVYPDRVGGKDQLVELVEGLRNNPFSRRHIISAWNPLDLDRMALPPCHTLVQFYVTPDASGEAWGLSCQLYQRSEDIFLGGPFNIASYAAMTYLLADLTGLVPLEFIHSTGDSHIYTNHVEQVKTQLGRRGKTICVPRLKIDHPVSDPSTVDVSTPGFFENYKISDFIVHDYDPLSSIKADVAI